MTGVKLHVPGGQAPPINLQESPLWSGKTPANAFRATHSPLTRVQTIPALQASHSPQSDRAAIFPEGLDVTRMPTVPSLTAPNTLPLVIFSAHRSGVCFLCLSLQSRSKSQGAHGTPRPGVWGPRGRSSLAASDPPGRGARRAAFHPLHAPPPACTPRFDAGPELRRSRRPRHV